MTKLASILLLACLCASCKTESTRPVVQSAAFPVALADIPHRAVARTVQSPQSVVPSPPKPMRLQWDYPQDRLWEIKNFNVYSNTGLNPLPWPLFAQPTQQFIEFMSTNRMRFFVVTAVGVSGEESGPNTK